jgi:peptide/nickel transport system substrate-binding protein
VLLARVRRLWAAPYALHNRWGVRPLAPLALGLLLAGALPASASPSRAASTPKIGGNIVVRVNAAPNCLDPYKGNILTTELVDYPVFDTLVSLNEKGKPGPYLAQKYAATNGGKTLTFYLRQNIKFSNGRQLTATDVKADFDRVRNPSTKSPNTSLLGPLTGITTSGKYTVTLKFSSPFRPILTNLGSAFLGIIDSKAAAAAGDKTCDGTGLIGTGPFKISSAGPGLSTVRLVRNPLHRLNPTWVQNKGQAYLSSITFTTITDEATSASELVTGQVDIDNRMSTDQLSRIQGNSSFKVYHAIGLGQSSLIFNESRPPFNNVAVRRAVAEAINRKAVAIAFAQNLGKASTSMLLPNQFAYDPGSATYAPKFIPSAARAAIAAAGATGPYTMLCPAVLNFCTQMEVVQAELAQVGMQVNIDSKDVAGWFSAGQHGADNMALMACCAGTDPDTLYSLFHSSQRSGGLNWTGVTFPKLDSLLQKGRTTLNLKAAKADYYQAQKLLDTQVYADPLDYSVEPFAVRSRIQGYSLTPNEDVPWQDVWVK